jgi:putative ABC transport system permease protein
VGVGALEPHVLQVLPFTAQLVGGAMTATTLAGRRMLDDAAADWATVEGWLAIGATPAQALAPLGRTAAARALAPALDQTRTVGLVTLPGAFVGLLLGGASPLEAARVQVLVLVGLIAAETIAVVVVTTGLGRRVTHRPDRS